MKKTLDSRSPRWWRGLGMTALVVATVALPACNDTTTNIPPNARSVINVEVVPNPIIGIQNTLTGSVSAAYIVRITELGGLGGKINFVSSTVFDPETGIQATVNYFDSADLTVFVGTDRIEANSELDVSQSTSYTLPEFRLLADLTVNVQVEDDRGGLINRSVLARVVPPPEPE